jgi:hypothetical protein
VQSLHFHIFAFKEIAGPDCPRLMEIDSERASAGLQEKVYGSTPGVLKILDGFSTNSLLSGSAGQKRQNAGKYLRVLTGACCGSIMPTVLWLHYGYSVHTFLLMCEHNSAFVHTTLQPLASAHAPSLKFMLQLHNVRVLPFQ